MFRLQKVNLKEKSWWAPQNSPLPPINRDYETKVCQTTCDSCRQDSPLIYNEGWMCVNYACDARGKIGGQAPTVPLTFNQEWLNERSQWPSGKMPEHQLAPPLVTDLDGTNLSTSPTAWGGFVCPKCQCCNSRIDWAKRICFADGCDFTEKVAHTVQTHRSLLPPNVNEVYGHAVSHSEQRGHVQFTKQFLGHWVMLTYKLCENNYITHFLANRHINGRPGGANDVFLQLQEGDGLGLKRSYMKNSIGKYFFNLHSSHLSNLSPGGSKQLTRHFARNFVCTWSFL